MRVLIKSEPAMRRGDAVPGRLHRDRQAVPLGETHGGDHVVCCLRLDHGDGARGDGHVPGGDGGVVLRGAGHVQASLCPREEVEQAAQLVRGQPGWRDTVFIVQSSL